MGKCLPERLNSDRLVLEPQRAPQRAPRLSPDDEGQATVSISAPEQLVTALATDLQRM